ncbi:MAG: 2-oxo-4-hydroxy-4-carboxy-5-ureidoimidazoline decarboxylase [Elusimicrobiota bacterium]
MTLEEFNALPAERAGEELERCCGASRWVEIMLKCRPFKDKAKVLSDAEATWSVMLPRDWMEAFEHHPRIGDKDALRERFAKTADWAKGEQAGAAAADEATLDALAAGNAEYEDKFGFLFIVCATGKSAKEMLALLNARLPNTQTAELKNAAAEQAKITKIRLEKLLS